MDRVLLLVPRYSLKIQLASQNVYQPKLSQIHSVNYVRGKQGLPQESCSCFHNFHSVHWDAGTKKYCVTNVLFPGCLDNTELSFRNHLGEGKSKRTSAKYCSTAQLLTEYGLFGLCLSYGRGEF